MKIDNRGISHYLVPLVIVVVIAVGGVYTLVSSHACSPAFSSPSNAQNSGGTAFSSPSNARNSNGTSFSSPSNAGACGAKSSTTKTSKQKNQKPPKQEQAQESDDSVNAPDGSTTGTVTVKNPPSSKSSYPPKNKPSGDITVATCIQVPAKPKQCDKTNRIGGVKVKVEKVSGSNNCDNRKNSVNTVKTNQTKKGKTKSGKTVTVYGLVHFLNCDAGQYKATYIGRAGYQSVSPKTRTFTVKDNETESPYFIVKKKAKKSSTTSTPAPSQANGDGTSTGGTEAPAQ